MVVREGYCFKSLSLRTALPPLLSALRPLLSALCPALCALCPAPLNLHPNVTLCIGVDNRMDELHASYAVMHSGEFSGSEFLSAD